MYAKRLTPEQALQKLKHYCTYQERCHNEVKQKLYGYRLYKKDVEQLISTLIEENYLNEERFAIQFAGGKFRMKQWGRRKIQYELQQKGVSTYCIKLAMKQVDDETYRQQLEKLAENKYEALRSEQYLVRQAKTTAYLVQKGYEPALVASILNEIVQRHKQK